MRDVADDTEFLDGLRDIKLQDIEEIVLAISTTNKRIVGVTSAETDDLVVSVARGVADFLARSGRSVLLVKLRQVEEGERGDGWTVSDLAKRTNLVHRRQGLDVIAIIPSHDSRYAFADTGQIRSALEGMLGIYQFIILELGAVITVSAETLNPLPFGAACDHVLLTCRRGIKRSLLNRVTERLRAARCVIGGIILNDAAYSTPGAEIARVASWLFWPLPWVRRRVQNWASNSDLLN